MKEKFKEEEDFYYNADGYLVLTSQYLLERGYCCGNGCKNCPYEYKMVPEPRRSRLLSERNNSGYPEENNKKND